MRQWPRSHLTYANVVATLALFVALGGGTALASYVISSNKQVGPGTISGHKPPSGDHANIVAGSINGKDIADRRVLTLASSHWSRSSGRSAQDPTECRGTG